METGQGERDESVYMLRHSVTILFFINHVPRKYFYQRIRLWVIIFNNSINAVVTKWLVIMCVGFLV